MLCFFIRRSADCIIENLSQSLVKLRLRDELEVNKLIELASMPKLEQIWTFGLSTNEENMLKMTFPDLKINEGFFTSIARPDQTYKRQNGFWEKCCKQLDIFSASPFGFQKSFQKSEENEHVLLRRESIWAGGL